LIYPNPAERLRARRRPMAVVGKIMMLMGRTIQTRFFMGLAGIVLFLSLFFGISLYLHMRDLLYSEVSSQANLVFSQVDSVQGYVRQTLRPKMYSILDHGDFIIEAMSSSFVSRQVMDRLRSSGQEHLYRRVAMDARNPDYEARGIELELVDFFRQNPKQTHWEGYKTLNDREYYVKARPVVFGKSCMACHGLPVHAPKSLLDRYGSQRGFGKTLGQLGGVDLVGVPLEKSLNMISEATLSYLVLYFSGIVLLYLMIHFFFTRLVSSKLKRLTNFYKERFDDLAGPQTLTRLEKGDEMDEMLQGIEELGQSLHTARKELQEHADTLRSIFEGVSDPMALLDGRGRVLVANQAAKGPAGHDAAKREPELFPELLAACGLDTDPNSLIKALGGKPFSRDIKLKDGYTYRLTLYPMPGDTAPQGRIVAYCREVTDEKRMLAQIQQSERLVSVGKLAAGLAHEMNNPLGVILCYADLLEQALKEDQQRQDLEVITRHARQAQSVLNDLLNFARAKPTTSGPLELRELISRVGQIFEVQAEARRVELSIEQADQPLMIEGNSQALEQILTNLLLNSLDAVEEDKGRVLIKSGLDRTRGEAIIVVADNGPGIAEEALGSIFDPFFSTKDVGQGTGLGLAVVYGLIHDMQGGIEVVNQGGAVFTLRFPLMQPDAEQNG
jgi:two-component system NtrC family sensor kinase